MDKHHSMHSYGNSGYRMQEAVPSGQDIVNVLTIYGKRLFYNAIVIF